MKVMHVKNLQIKLLKKSINYLKTLNKKKIDISLSPLCFLTTWAKNPGNFKLNQFLGNSVDYIYLLKNILSISKNHDLSLFFNKKFREKNYYKAIVSYSSQKNFDKNGNFFDPYFNLSSKNKKYTWFLISLDSFIPKKIDDNLVIVSKKKKSSLSLIYLIKKLFFIIIEHKFSISKIIHYCWLEYDFSKRINDLFLDFFDDKKIKKILLNYECIPFQNSIINIIKKKNKNVKVLAYLHCAPWPLQTDLIFKNFLIDVLFVSSQNQKIVLKKFLGWKKQKIRVIPSLRFTKNKKREFNNYIFLPYNLKSNNNYYSRFERFILSLPKIKLGKMKIRVHPLNKDSIIHKNLKTKLEDLLVKNRKRFSMKINNKSVFFGSATGVCVQALEEGTEIIHFPDNKTDIFSNYFWKYIKVKYLNDNIYQYGLRRFNSTFLVNYEKKKFEKYMQF